MENNNCQLTWWCIMQNKIVVRIKKSWQLLATLLFVCNLKIGVCVSHALPMYFLEVTSWRPSICDTDDSNAVHCAFSSFPNASNAFCRSACSFSTFGSPPMPARKWTYNTRLQFDIEKFHTSKMANLPAYFFKCLKYLQGKWQELHHNRKKRREKVEINVKFTPTPLTHLKLFQCHANLGSLNGHVREKFLTSS